MGTKEGSGTLEFCGSGRVAEMRIGLVGVFFSQGGLGGGVWDMAARLIWLWRN